MKQNNKQHNYAFIDSQNLNVTVQNLGWKIDWKKFRRYLQKNFGVENAYMFIGYVPEYESLYEQLHDAGYMIVLKPTFDLTKPRATTISAEENKEDDKEKRPVKGNVDAELVLWAMKEINNYKQAVIVSGDGDFYSLVEYLEERHKLKNILTPSGHYSALYNRYENYIHRLDLHRKELSYSRRIWHKKGAK